MFLTLRRVNKKNVIVRYTNAAFSRWPQRNVMSIFKVVAISSLEFDEWQLYSFLMTIKTGSASGPSHKGVRMAHYVDGFVLAVPKKNVKKYKKIAQTAGKIWKEYGALEYIECVADDVKKGKWTSFPQSVKLKPTEKVVFSWIVYKSRADRDRIVKKVMNDPRLQNMDTKIFDGKRMIYGGFKSIVEI